MDVKHPKFLQNEIGVYFVENTVKDATSFSESTRFLNGRVTLFIFWAYGLVIEVITIINTLWLFADVHTLLLYFYFCWLSPT